MHAIVRAITRALCRRVHEGLAKGDSSENPGSACPLAHERPNVALVRVTSVRASVRSHSGSGGGARRSQSEKMKSARIRESDGKGDEI